MEIKANDPTLTSWIEVKADSDFSMQNIPFGIYSDGHVGHHACTAIGEYILDLHEMHQLGYFKGITLPHDVFSAPTLNDFIALGKEVSRAVRNRISELLNISNMDLQGSAGHREKIFKLQNNVQLLLPIHIGDYTDFYSSKEHATNVGIMFRGKENAIIKRGILRIR